MSVLSVHGLSVARGERALFTDLEFALDAGDLLHLRGRNGAGKTTLLETLCGLRRPAAGELRAPEPSALHWLGHRNALNPALTPLENLEFWCGLNGVDARAVLPALERTGVARLRYRACRTLSAGQKRRTALARLLLSRRVLWLLDEPLDGLDADGLALFATLLAEHLDGGGAALVTSHQPLPPGLARVRVLHLA